MNEANTHPHNSSAPSGRLHPVCSVSPEEWWAKHAALLAHKMKLGGVKSFNIERMPSGKYAFSVEPEHDTTKQELLAACEIIGAGLSKPNMDYPEQLSR